MTETYYGVVLDGQICLFGDPTLWDGGRVSLTVFEVGEDTAIPEEVLEWARELAQNCEPTDC
jgi:hypothetical protein